VKRVKCNHCGSIFDEEYIGLLVDVEFCRCCGQTGALMDMDVGGGEPFRTPDEWESDTGKPLSDEALVWVWSEHWHEWSLTSKGIIRALPLEYNEKELRVVNGPYKLEALA
jgi:hypothetical protein